MGRSPRHDAGTVVALVRSFGRGCAPLLFAGVLGLPLGGCATVGYYYQAIFGHLEIMAKRRGIGAVVDDPNTKPAVRERLLSVDRIRQFAEDELALPAGGSYRAYVDVERPYVTWAVVATPEFSLTPIEWCFPVVGCLTYRGYFSPEPAHAFAARLRADGHDAHVSGASAYSTLGWFDDPILNTMLGRHEWQLVSVVFHELAHRRIYLAGDSTFSESYAVAVEREGVRRWLAQDDGGTALTEYEHYLEQFDAANVLLAQARARLSALYASDRPAAQKRSRKAAEFASLRRTYQTFDAARGGRGWFARWFEGGPNNARLALLATYHELVPVFDTLLARHSGELGEFHRVVERLAELDTAERHRFIAEIRDD